MQTVLGLGDNSRLPLAVERDDVSVGVGLRLRCGGPSHRSTADGRSCDRTRAGGTQHHPAGHAGMVSGLLGRGVDLLVGDLLVGGPLAVGFVHYWPITSPGTRLRLCDSASIWSENALRASSGT